tara:strand:- start:99 stop:746 length:648 start_codon:yes stop_codon:yes gene_type:complete
MAERNIAEELLSSLARDSTNRGYSVEQLAEYHGLDKEMGAKALDAAIDKAIEARVESQEISTWEPWRDEVRRRGDEPAHLSPASGTITTGHYGPPGPGEAVAPEWAIKDPSMPKYPSSIPIVDREAWENKYPRRTNPFSEGFEDISYEAWKGHMDADRADKRRYRKREDEKDAIETEAYASRRDYLRRPGGQSYMPPGQAEEILKGAAKKPKSKK